MKTKLTAVDRLKRLVGRFERTAARYSGFGAADSEPDAVFQQLLVRAFLGKEPPALPGTADGWCLYRDEKGVGLAAANLRRSAIAPVEFINHGRKAWNMDQAGEVEEYLRDYCWRVSW